MQQHSEAAKQGRAYQGVSSGCFQGTDVLLSGQLNICPTSAPGPHHQQGLQQLQACLTHCCLVIHAAPPRHVNQHLHILQSMSQHPKCCWNEPAS